MYQQPLRIRYADMVTAPGMGVTLKGVIDGNFSQFAWTPQGLFTNANMLTPVTVPVEANQTIILTVHTVEGCRVSDTAELYVNNQLAMPNAFTPNRDGANDVFRIPSHVTLQLQAFSIFDRWGRRVFHTTDIDKEWDGDQATTGVYVYMISGIQDGQKRTYKGALSLPDNYRLFGMTRIENLDSILSDDDINVGIIKLDNLLVNCATMAKTLLIRQKAQHFC
jgi:gliding motility-associated-like protein